MKTRVVLSVSLVLLLAAVIAFTLSSGFITQAQGTSQQPVQAGPLNGLSEGGHKIDPARQAENERVLEKRQILVDRWVASIRDSNAGWIHTKIAEDKPDDTASLDAEGNIIIPADFILETWTQVDKDDTVIAQLTIMWDADGNMLQYARLLDSISYNSFQDSASKVEPSLFVWAAPIYGEEIKRITQEQATLNGREVTLIASERLIPAIPLDSMDGAAISGIRQIETFDTLTSQLLRVEVMLLMANGTEQLASVNDILLYETVTDLPEYAAELFNQKIDVEIREANHHE